jgi:hypothetical protein
MQYDRVGAVAASALSASCTGVLSQQNESRQCCHLALGDVSSSLLLRTIVDKIIGTFNIVSCSDAPKLGLSHQTTVR